MCPVLGISNQIERAITIMKLATISKSRLLRSEPVNEMVSLSSDRMVALSCGHYRSVSTTVEG
jgi:hypothetical protein